MNTTKKRISISLLSLLLLLALVLGLGISASAAETTTKVYTTYGKYTVDGTTYNGCPSSYFNIKMHGSTTSSTGMLYNDWLINWSYYYIKVEDVDIRAHKSFKLYRNGSLYSNKTLSGTGDLTLYVGGLSTGKYELQYVANVGSALSNKDYTYKFSFEVDATAPVCTMKAGGNVISSGSYTNKQVTFSATDDHTISIRAKKPGTSSYILSSSNPYTIGATEANNGWWYLYAEDNLDNESTVYSFYMDTVAPVGKVTNSSGTTIANGGYTNKAIKYTATDTGGVSYYQVKTPGSSSWTSYTAGTVLSSSYGWYTFRAVDKAGNISEEYKVYYDAAVPTGTLYGGSTIKSSGSYTNAAYVKYTVTDANSGIANCYVKMPGSSSYTAYASGTQLATEGTYSFYAIDKAGNQTAIVTITLDKTKPTGTIYGGSSVVSSGSYTNADFVKFMASDNIGLSSIYVKNPGAEGYVAYTSGTQLTAEGTYSFYAVDKAGNQSATYSVIVDRHVPEGTLYVDDKPIDSGSYSNGSHIKFECADSCFVKVPGSDSFTAYLSGTEYYKPGMYVFYAQSKAGTSSLQYTIVIDRTEKSVESSNVIDGKTNGDVMLYWEDGDSSLYAPIKSVTINGKPYTKGEVICTINGGAYQVVVTDAAGNVWTTAFASTKVNLWADDKEVTGSRILANRVSIGKNVTATLDGKSFTSSVVETEGKHTLVIADNWGNKFSYQLTIVRRTPDICYALGNGENNTATFDQVYYFKDQVKISIADEFDTTAVFYVYDGNGKLVGQFGREQVCTLTDSGSYTVKAVNHAGTSNVFRFQISRNAPKAEIIENAEKKQLIISITESVDSESHIQTVAVYKSIDGGKTWTRLEQDDYGVVINVDHDRYAFRTSGLYKVVVTDEFRIDSDAVTAVFDYAQKAPEYELVGVENGGITNSIVKFRWTDETVVTVTKNGTVIPYKSGQEMNTDGDYTITIANFDGYSKTLSFTIDTIAPDVEIEGAEHGKTGNSDVKIIFTEELTVDLIRNGESIGAYESGSVISAEGSYRIRLVDLAGNETVVEFVIDKTVDCTVEVKDNVATVTVGENATAVLVKDGEKIDYTLGEEISTPGGYTLTVTDEVGNTAEFTFTIAEKEVEGGGESGNTGDTEDDNGSTGGDDNNTEGGNRENGGDENGNEGSTADNTQPEGPTDDVSKKGSGGIVAIVVIIILVIGGLMFFLLKRQESRW